MGQRVVSLTALATGAAIAGTIGTGGAGEAVAQSRPPAPIVYAGQGATPASHAPVPAAAPSPKAAPAARERARIQFIYPEHPQPEHAPPEAPIEAVSVEPQMPATQAPAAVLESPVVEQPVPAQPITPPPSAAPIEAAPAVSEGSAHERFQPVAGPVFDEVGMASWYGEAFHGRPTANGETFDMRAMTAAHPTLPLPSLIQVVNLQNDKEVVVRVNDRGPFIEGRILDLSMGAAEVLDFIDQGETRVRIRYLGPAPVAGTSAPDVPGGETEPDLPLTPVPSSEPTPAPSPAPAPAPAPAPVPAPQAEPAPDRVAPTPIGYEPPRSRGQYFIQLGAFASISNAERLKTTLSANLPVAVQPVRVNGADLFRVLVGPWPDEARAEAVQADLAARDFGSGMVVANP